jgi:DNA-binding NarL/FixJ family response regulator
MNSNTQSEISIVIADDHAMLRSGLRNMLDSPLLRIVGEASNGEEAVRLVMDQQPAVVLMDVRMPKMDGIQALEAIKNAKSTARVIMLTSYSSPMYLLRALSAGAAGFVLKDISQAELLKTIYAVAGGSARVDSQFLQSVLRSLDKESDIPDHLPDNIEPLTTREMDILRLMVEGLTNQAIGEALGLSSGTVKGYAHTIIQKLGTNHRTEAVVKAIRLGLVK